MSHLDPSRPPEERIQQAIDARPRHRRGRRFGPVTTFVRKLVGRAVKYERDFNLEIDVALLDKVHEVETTAAAAVAAAERGCRAPTTTCATPTRISARPTERQRIGHRRARSTAFNTMERNDRPCSATPRSTTSTTGRCGRERSLDGDGRRANAPTSSYDEMTATPYIADETRAALHRRARPARGSGTAAARARAGVHRFRRPLPRVGGAHPRPPARLPRRDRRPRRRWSTSAAAAARCSRCCGSGHRGDAASTSTKAWSNGHAHAAPTCTTATRWTSS